MSTRVMEQVDEWDGRPFEGGYTELHTLAEESFSGVIRAGRAELYMTKGTAVGVQGGTITDFEGASGTAYEAPSPALPLLAVMQDQEETARAEYYTEDTDLAQVDSKLADGGFTGYVELSENVLSGDYFIVYHQGRSMSAAFVGPESRVKTDDEARERATDEIGIYRVYPADIDPVEIPASEPDPEPTAESGAGSSAKPQSETDSPQSETDSPQSGTDSPQSGIETEYSEAETATATAGPVGETAEEGGGTETDVAESDDEASAEGDVSSAGSGTQESSQKSPRTAEATAEASTGTADRRVSDGADTTRPDADSGGRTAGSTSEEANRSTRTGPASSQSSAGEQPTPASDRAHLETRSIPSLDPGRTQTSDTGTEEPESGRTDPLGGSDTGPASGPRTRGHNPDGKHTSRRRDETDPPSEPDEQRREPSGGSGGSIETESDTARVEQLEETLEDREEEIDRLEIELESATEEQERLEAELESATEEQERLEEDLTAVRAEREDLEAEVERLTAELDRLETEFGAATEREQRISIREALDGTDVFVRYRSKGDETLDDAHDSGIRQTDVVENICLEKHTQFDAGGVSVGGQTYQEFLDTRIEFQFVRWVAEELLFEIRDTGQADALRTLYDALPEIDRAELGGTVDAVRTENGEETHTTEEFDVVYRDRMGDPLLVANINDSREAATESMMTDLITAAKRVGQSNDGFAAAFLVTESFFEPGALETASEATRSGFLKRSKRKSFVNLSRKQGYHLCLVEARSENFSISVPEL